MKKRNQCKTREVPRQGYRPPPVALTHSTVASKPPTSAICPTERQAGRQRERERERETHSERQRDRETERGRQAGRQAEITHLTAATARCCRGQRAWSPPRSSRPCRPPPTYDTHRHARRHGHTQRHTETHRDTQRHTETQHQITSQNA